MTGPDGSEPTGRGFEASRNYLSRTFADYLGNLNDRLPRDSNGVLQVLSVGCGIAEEAKAFANQEVFSNAHYSGMDNDDLMLQNAEFFNRDLSLDRATFVKEDVRAITDEKKGIYGVVIIRNPRIIPFGHGQADPHFIDIIKASCQRLAANGYIVVTTEEQSRLEMITQVLEENNIQIQLGEENRFHEEAPLQQAHKDYHLIIGQKPV